MRFKFKATSVAINALTKSAGEGGMSSLIIRSVDIYFHEADKLAVGLSVIS